LAIYSTQAFTDVSLNADGASESDLVLVVEACNTKVLTIEVMRDVLPVERVYAPVVGLSTPNSWVNDGSDCTPPNDDPS